MKKTVYCPKSEPESDIHLSRDLDEGQEGMVCLNCILIGSDLLLEPIEPRFLSEDGRSFVLKGTWMQYPMTHHVRDHFYAGHQVPEHVFDRLELEIHE